MKFSCDQCNASYMIADEKLGDRGVKVRCKRCGESIIVRPGEAQADDENEGDDASGFTDDSTKIGPPPEFSEQSDPANEASGFDGGATRVGEFDPAALDQQALAGGDASPPRPLDVTLEGKSEGSDLTMPMSDGSMDLGLGDLDLDDDDSSEEAPFEPPALSSLEPSGEAEASSIANMTFDPSLLDAAAQEEEAAEAEAAAQEAAAQEAAAQEAAAQEAEEAAAQEAAEAVAAQEAGDGEEDQLDDQIAGAFNDMFNDADSLPDPEEPPPPDFAAAIEGGVGMPIPGAGFQETSGDFGMGDLEAGIPDESYVDPLLAASGGTTNANQASSGYESDESDDEEIEWFVAIDDEEKGPLTLEEVGLEVQNGKLLRGSLVWKTGLDDWIPADDVPEVADFFDASAPGKYSSMLDGAPVDDDDPLPSFTPDAKDPFAGVPDLAGHDDPAWQPHGLTEVYQAANLAEAAQGNVKTPFAEPEIPAAKDDNDDEGWSPNAASALSALVQDEMGRLDDGPDVGAAILPADDELGLSSNALDDLPGNSASSSALGATLADLEASSAAVPAPGPTTSLHEMPAVQISAPVTATAPMAPSLPPSYAHDSGGRSPIIYVAGGLAAFMMLGVFVLVAIALLREKSPGPVEEPRVAVLSPAPSAPAPAPAPAPAVAVASPPGPKVVAPPSKDEPRDDAAAVKAEEDVKIAALSKTEKLKKETPKSKKPRRSKLRKPKRPKPKPKPKLTLKPKPKPKKPQSKSGCDPVLDFDCEEKSSKKRKPKTLSKSDILAVAKKNIRKIKACGKKYGVKAKIKVKWKISRSGATRGVKVKTAKYEGSQVGSCLVRVVKKWRFPSYSGKEMKPITFPFKL